ncbi:MAG: prepilin-type N-terminal cleavage/methylation domain-containing protein [Puniceicoccales bacterium]|nr:prepilin-type N-terminal cleavage/methylation domain-containing protein [Puniceicoccales bacterium]
MDTAIQRYSDTAIQRYKGAFTLIEIVFTLSIIGILLAILLPTISTIKFNAQKVRDIVNLKKIAEAWKSYIVDNNFEEFSFHNNGMEFPCYLSGGSTNETGWKGWEKCILNDPYAYVSNGDKYATKVLRPAICGPRGNSNAYLDPYSRVKNDITTSSSAITLSYCTISGLSAFIPLSTTPIAFTRGLKVNGKWHPKYGLYGDKGGYVVFGDGHAKWFDGDRPAIFLKWNQNSYSNDIRDAIPNSAFISCGHLMNSNIKDTDDSLLLIFHVGIGGL